MFFGVSGSRSFLSPDGKRIATLDLDLDLGLDSPEKADPLRIRIKPDLVLFKHGGVLERRAVQTLTVFAVAELGLEGVGAVDECDCE